MGAGKGWEGRELGGKEKFKLDLQDNSLKNACTDEIKSSF